MNNRWQLYKINDYKKINSILDNKFSKLMITAKKSIREGEEPILSGRNAKASMEEYMYSIDGYGASDTEPRATLMTLICEELGLPLNQKTIDQLQ